MKSLNVLLLIGCMAGIVTIPPVAAKSVASVQTQQTAAFSIEKMTCKMCHITVRKAMEKVDGVVKATVDYDSATATVVFDPNKTNLQAIALASTNAGYPATVKNN